MRALLAALLTTLMSIAALAQAPPTAMRPPGLREITTSAANTGVAADCYGTIVWNSATAGAKTQTLPSCPSGAAIRIVDGKGDAGIGGEISVTAGTGATLGLVPAGTYTLLIGASNGSVELTYDGPSTNWVLTSSSNPGAVVTVSTNPTVFNGQWFSGAVFQFNGAGQTLTLPAFANATANGGITVQSVSFSGTIKTAGSDTMSGPGVTGGNTLSLPNNSTVAVTKSAGGYSASVAPLELQTATWLVGQNLAGCSTPPCYIPLFPITNARTIVAASCQTELVGSGTATLGLFIAPTTGPLSAGSAPSGSTLCNAALANTAPQTVLGAALAVAANSTIGVVTSSTWCATCSGSLAITLQ
jgi:hypothetical protein